MEIIILKKMEIIKRNNLLNNILERNYEIFIF